MRKLRVWGLSAVLLAGGLGVSAATAADTKDSSDPPPAKSGWNWDTFNVFGSKDKPAPASEKAKTGDAEAEHEAAKAPAKPDPAAMLKMERDKLMRRTAACLRLQEIALQTNDTELHRVAEQLSDRAYAVYLQRTANLGGGASMMAESSVPPKPMGPGTTGGQDPKEN